jgi:hypothetical protein
MTRMRRKRTTLVIDEDVLRFAQEMAAIEKKSVGEVIASLARRALYPTEADKLRTRNGVPLLNVRKGASRVTSELAHRVRERLP